MRGAAVPESKTYLQNRISATPCQQSSLDVKIKRRKQKKKMKQNQSHDSVHKQVCWKFRIKSLLLFMNNRLLQLVRFQPELSKRHFKVCPQHDQGDVNFSYLKWICIFSDKLLLNSNELGNYSKCIATPCP